jgi:hypothetical protein
MGRLWQILAPTRSRFAPNGVVELLCDDTLHHKSGRKVNGAGVFRDAVRSTVRRVVYALAPEPRRHRGAGTAVLGRLPDRDRRSMSGCTARTTPRPPSATPSR